LLFQRKKRINNAKMNTFNILQYLFILLIAKACLFTTFFKSVGDFAKGRCYHNQLAVIEISAVGTSGQEAAALADEFTAELLRFLGTRDNAAWAQEVEEAEGDVELLSNPLEEIDERRQALKAEAAGLEEGRVLVPEVPASDRLSDVSEELAGIEIERAHPGSSVRTGVVRARWAQPPRRSGTGLGALVGLFLSATLAMLRLRLDPRLRTKAQVEEAFDLPVLSEIPKFERNTDECELHAVTRSRSAVTEAYRVVRSSLLFARSATAFSQLANASAAERGDVCFNSDSGVEVVHGSEVRVIMVTSPGPSEAKTTTTANLAVLLGEAGYDVLVVNCDYRIPKLHRFFGQSHETRRTMETGVGGVTLIADVASEGEANPTTVRPTRTQRQKPPTHCADATPT